MARNTSANNDAGIVLAITKPIYLLKMGFTTELRISSRETMTFDGDSYVGVPNMKVTLSQNPVVRWMNVNLTYGTVLIDQGIGQDVILYVLYGTPPFNSGDEDVYHSGIIGSGEINSEYVEIVLLPNEPVMSPIFRATDGIFKHLPPDGTEILTQSGLQVLKRS